MKIKKLYLFFIYSLVLIINYPALASEQYEINFSKEQQIDSLFGNMKQDFYISKSWDVEEISLKLLFSNSPLIDSDISSITCTINDEYFYSARVPNNKEDIKQLETIIPKRYLKKGTNTLGVYTYMRVNEKLPCVDDANIANWITINKDSLIAIRYKTNKIYSSISEFYNRFIDVDTLRKNKNIIMVSNKNNLKEIEAATITLMGISGQKLDREAIVQIKPLESIADVKQDNIIYISLYDNLLPNIKNKINKEITDKLTSNVWINLLEMPDKKNVLVVTSQNEGLLRKAGLVLGDRELISQYQGKYKLTNYEDIGQKRKIEGQELKQITTSGEYLKGNFRQQKEFYINYPRSRCIAEGSQIYLDYRYSENLDFDRSLVTVYINEYPIGSKKLEKQNANKDNLTLDIPNDLNISGNFNIKVAFELEQKDLWCTLRNMQTPWAYVSEESMMKINSKEQPFMLFENYPSPFIKDNSVNNLLIVVPEGPQGYIYESLSNVATTLGLASGINRGDIGITTDVKISANRNEKNIIVIGTYKENGFIRELNTQLFFKFSEDGAKILGNEKLAIDDEYSHQLGTLQLLRSPFNNNKGIMVVTGPKPEGVLRASKNISAEKELWKLYGDGIIVDRQGEVKNYRFKEENKKEMPVIEQILKRQDIKNFIIVSILILGLVITATSFMLKKYFLKP